MTVGWTPWLVISHTAKQVLLAAAGIDDRAQQRLLRMIGAWRIRAARTDRDFSCADEMEGLLHETSIEELQMLTVHWHALADLAGGSHECADELGAFVRRHLRRSNYGATG